MSVGKTTSIVFKLTDAIYGFPVSRGSAEALVRWRDKLSIFLIAYFIYTRQPTIYYQNQSMDAGVLGSKIMCRFKRCFCISLYTASIVYLYL